MKKSLVLLGTATIASLALACAAEDGPTPVDGGDGDGAMTTGGTVGAGW